MKRGIMLYNVPFLFDSLVECECGMIEQVTIKKELLALYG